MLLITLCSLLILSQDPGPALSDPAAEGAAQALAPVFPLPEFPERALYRGVERGDVVLDCLVLESGSLSDCRIVSEEPVGMGFGMEALRAGRRARVSAVSAAAAGLRLRFAIRFRLAEEPAAALEPTEAARP